MPGPAIDEPIAMVTAAGATTYFHTNRQGSVIAMSGIPVTQYLIDCGTYAGIDTLSYAWDTVGRLTMRSDTLEGTTEKFCYSQIDALVNSSFGSTCTDTSAGSYHVGLTYTANGNIASKSDIGTYSYGGSGAGPHAVSSIDTTTGCSLSACTVNGVSNPSFTYDANGNMTAGAGRTLTYTPFNMAATITQGSSTYTLYYDDTHSRIAQVGPSTTTLYLNALGGMSEKVGTTWHDYIVAPGTGSGAGSGQLVAERFCTGAAPCASSGATLKYFVTDHLGSIAMVLNNDGSMAEHLSFGAWGMRRNADGSPASCGAISSSTTRGYTGQEEMDGLCLINMNARLYDPEIGRFMSADSIVPDPFDMQSFNRYSYVLNNPLEYTDPTGHYACGSDVFVDGKEWVTICATGWIPEPGEIGGGQRGQEGLNDRPSHGGDRDHSGEKKQKGKNDTNGACSVASSIARSIISQIQKLGGVNTGSTSLAGGVSGLGFSLQGFGGFAIDGQGNVAFIYGGGGFTSGGSAGFSWNAGVNASVSNARSVNSLSGIFANQSLSVGDGLAGGVDSFEGTDTSGQGVLGGGVTVGVGGGASLNGGLTDTVVVPLCG